MTKPAPKDTIETEDAFESVKLKTDEPGVIRGVKLLGLRSRNKRNYDTPGVRDSGVRLMEGAQVYIDHPEKAETPRSYRDKFGQIRNVRYEPGKGHFGDLHYNPKHQAAEQFLWDVENSPNTQGLSINSKIKPGKTNKSGDTDVEALEMVRSVDIVTKPATNTGIFESELPEEDETMDLDTLKKNHPDLYKQVVKEATESDATESELETLRKANEATLAKLKEFEAKEEAVKHRNAVEAEFALIFKDSLIPADVQKDIFECACEMAAEPRKKLHGVVSKLNPMLVEVPDDDEDDDETPAKPKKVAKEEVDADEQVDDAEEEEKPVKGKSYKPGRRGGSYNFLDAVGLKVK